jgi:UDP-N-acetylmuramate dehydrogenase
MNSIIEKIKNLNLTYQFHENVSFKKSSWFGVEGVADVVFKIDKIENLSNLIKLLPKDIPIVPIGVTSNLLIRKNFHGIIIKPRFNEMKVLNNRAEIEVGSSVLDINLANFAAENNISGFEFFNTIPGTIGGAIAMNSGCYDGEIANLLISLEGVNKISGEIRTFTRNEISFEYRHNPLKDWIWTKAILRGQHVKNNEQIYKKMKKFYDQRIASQPKNCKTSGSTFCNPEGHQVWKLIDQVGLRGYRIGGAHFSNHHCNFIINDANAEAEDIIALIELAEKKVFEQFNIQLKREIVII